MDPLAKRAAVAAIGRARRELVCESCVTGADDVIGKVHSDRGCSRCKREPMGYGAVVASNTPSPGTSNQP